MPSSAAEARPPGTAVPEPRSSTVLRWLTAAGVLVSAVVHLYLYLDGFDAIEIIGPLFLLNGVAGIVIGLALLVWRHPVWLVAAVGFSAATALAFLVSTTVGLFGVREPFWGVSQTTALVAELVGLVCGALLLARWWRRRR
ncbi:hypothetical protein V2J56_04040 [Georgenia sp. MJ206]|uniref:hypothetical protein n=1 Tax=Georgenia wangjunii TaxID=3117730 RepID=UPI002F26B74A